MHKTVIATFSGLETLKPTYALVADVDLVVIRLRKKQTRFLYSMVAVCTVAR